MSQAPISASTLEPQLAQAIAAARHALVATHNLIVHDGQLNHSFKLDHSMEIDALDRCIDLTNVVIDPRQLAEDNTKYELAKLEKAHSLMGIYHSLLPGSLSGSLSGSPTGRLKASKPEFQNIPIPRTPLGDEIREKLMGPTVADEIIQQSLRAAIHMIVTYRVSKVEALNYASTPRLYSISKLYKRLHHELDSLVQKETWESKSQTISIVLGMICDTLLKQCASLDKQQIMYLLRETRTAQEKEVKDAFNHAGLVANNEILEQIEGWFQGRPITSKAGVGWWARFSELVTNYVRSKGGRVDE